MLSQITYLQNNYSTTGVIFGPGLQGIVVQSIKAPSYVVQSSVVHHAINFLKQVKLMLAAEQ